MINHLTKSRRWARLGGRLTTGNRVGSAPPGQPHSSDTWAGSSSSSSSIPPGPAIGGWGLGKLVEGTPGPGPGPGPGGVRPGVALKAMATLGTQEGKEVQRGGMGVGGSDSIRLRGAPSYCRIPVTLEALQERARGRVQPPPTSAPPTPRQPQRALPSPPTPGRQLAPLSRLFRHLVTATTQLPDQPPRACGKGQPACGRGPRGLAPPTRPLLAGRSLPRSPAGRR